jgi:hypothetical protein
MITGISVQKLTGLQSLLSGSIGSDPLRNEEAHWASIGKREVDMLQSLNESGLGSHKTHVRLLEWSIEARLAARARTTDYRIMH